MLCSRFFCVPVLSSAALLSAFGIKHHDPVLVIGNQDSAVFMDLQAVRYLVVLKRNRSQAPLGSHPKDAPKGTSTTDRFACMSNEGPSRKLSTER